MTVSIGQTRRELAEELNVPSTEVRSEAGGRGRGLGDRVRSLRTAQVGIWIFLGTVTMLFAGFTSAYLVRRGGADWAPIAAPKILWLNCLVLLLSSAMLEGARFAQRREKLGAMKKWLFGTAVCGFVFLIGQLIAWQQLVARGVYLPTNPHSSFFFMLTGVHAFHLFGGIAAISYLLLRTWKGHAGTPARGALNPCATYWHFVDGLWLYLFFILFEMKLSLFIDYFLINFQMSLKLIIIIK